ncbi:SRPBCC family protein [Mangrovicella endophytica]|uniref:SRPBCC family protein n=1 Tax=Mangrovicella endophytica TaxID=2066697 RepID=UPI000C9DBF53|nr:SRPBCC domain-containing protein [Mangrovicella endophytica]
MNATHETPDFVITRSFQAPRQRVWEAWTKPELFSRWFGPKGTTTHVEAFDLRPGGMLHYAMVMPDGSRMWGRSVYREIVEPSRLVWVNSFADAQGAIIRAPFFDGKWPLEMLTTVAFADEGTATRVTLTWRPIEASDEERRTFASNTASMNEGWSGSFDRLDEVLD